MNFRVCSITAFLQDLSCENTYNGYRAVSKIGYFLDLAIITDMDVRGFIQQRCFLPRKKFAGLSKNFSFWTVSLDLDATFKIKSLLYKDLILNSTGMFRK